MEGVKIFDDIAHRDGLKATDKLLIGNADSGALEHVTVQEIVDLVPSSPGGGQPSTYVGMVNYHFYTAAFYARLSDMTRLEGCFTLPEIFGSGDNRVYGHAAALPPISADKVTLQRFDPRFEMVIVFSNPNGGPGGSEIGNTYAMSGNKWPSSYPVTYNIPPEWPPYSMYPVIRKVDNTPIEPRDVDMLQWTITTGVTLSDWFPNWYEQLMNISSK